MSVYDAVTAQILKALKTGTPPWVQSWIQILKEDKRAIFKASALAAKAADYLRSFSREEPGDA